MLKDNGAERVFAFATHGLLSGPALERINESVLEEVCVTDTLPQEQNLVKCSKLRVLTVAPLLVEVSNDRNPSFNIFFQGYQQTAL